MPLFNAIRLPLSVDEAERRGSAVRAFLPGMRVVLGEGRRCREARRVTDDEADGGDRFRRQPRYPATWPRTGGFASPPCDGFALATTREVFNLTSLRFRDASRNPGNHQAE